MSLKLLNTEVQVESASHKTHANQKYEAGNKKIKQFTLKKKRYYLKQNTTECNKNI
jgi:hypothetical protein